MFRVSRQHAACESVKQDDHDGGESQQAESGEKGGFVHQRTQATQAPSSLAAHARATDAGSMSHSV